MIGREEPQRDVRQRPFHQMDDPFFRLYMRGLGLAALSSLTLTYRGAANGDLLCIQWFIHSLGLVISASGMELRRTNPLSNVGVHTFFAGSLIFMQGFYVPAVADILGLGGTQ